MSPVRSSAPPANLWVCLIALGALAVAGCQPDPPPAAPDASRPAAPFAVELVGAKAWRRDAPPIFTEKKRPRIILPAALGPVTATAGGAPVELVPQTTSADHQAYALHFEPPSERFELRITDRAGRARAWTIAWPSPTTQPALDALAKLIDRARKEARSDEARAVETRKAAAEQAARAGLTSLASQQWRAVGHLAMWRTDLRAQAAALERAEQHLVPADRTGRLSLDYQRGLLAKLTGDLRMASRLLSDAVDLATHLGLQAHAQNFRMALANVMVRQGRFGAALVAYDRIAPGPTAAPQVRRFWHSNIAWAMALGMESGALPRLPSVAAWHLNEALANADAPTVRAHILVNLTAVELQRGYLGAARVALDLALGLDPDRLGAGWLRLTQGEIALERGDWAAAEQAFMRAAGMGPVADRPDAETSWRAIAGLARLSQAMQQPALARAMFDEAGRRVDALAAQVQLADTSGAFYAGRRRLFDAWARFLLSDPSLAEGDRAAASWAVVEASQARVVRSLQRQSATHDPAVVAQTRKWLGARARFEAARARSWTVAASERPAWRARREAARAELDAELRALMDATPRARSVSPRQIRAALPTGAIILSFRQLGDAVHAYLVDAQGVQHRAVSGDDLIGEWRAAVEGARHVYWVAGNVPAAQHLDRHPVGGRPLAAAVSQSRLPFAGLLLAEARPVQAPPVVVADPEGNLAWARTEATDLPGRRLTGEAAHRSAVLAAIDGAHLMHFAGHGVLRTDSPWDAHLRLARQTRLTLGDLLTARPAVGTVVLNGCSTGIALDLGGEERIGLPTAFLLAGAEVVIATRVDVADADARRFIDRFYAAGGAARPALAFRDAVRASVTADDLAWTHFELMGRP